MIKDLAESSYETAGVLTQAAANAVDKKLQAMCKKTYQDAAFFRVRITLDFSVLNNDFSAVMQVVRVSEVSNWNMPTVREENEG